MTIKEEIRDNVALLFLKGNMMGGPESMEVHEKVKSLLGDKIKKIVIDLSKVKWMNSSGLGALMASMTSLKNSDGELKISGATGKIQNLFMITKLLTIFDTYETADRAIASFKSWRSEAASQTWNGKEFFSSLPFHISCFTKFTDADKQEFY